MTASRAGCPATIRGLREVNEHVEVPRRRGASARSRTRGTRPSTIWVDTADDFHVVGAPNDLHHHYLCAPRIPIQRLLSCFSPFATISSLSYHATRRPAHCCPDGIEGRVRQPARRLRFPHPKAEGRLRGPSGVVLALVATARRADRCRRCRRCRCGCCGRGGCHVAVVVAAAGGRCARELR